LKENCREYSDNLKEKHIRIEKLVIKSGLNDKQLLLTEVFIGDVS